MKTKFYTKDIIEICDNKHLTVDEIFELISQKHPLAGKSSIYRNVEELSISGELKKVVGASKKTYFEKSKHPHLHLIDEETGKIIDIDIDKMPNFSLPNGFEISDFDIKFYGKLKKN